MVAVIKTSASINRVFNYNESKVKQGVAECIGAGNYPIDPDKMTPAMKLNRFLKQMQLNENVKRNSVHISLNFDPSERNLTKDQLLSIAESYMDKIGFGRQPYLVYQHSDAGHPHIHVVTTNIESSGSRIDLHHLGIRKSEPARKAIEKEFGLVAAEAQKKQELCQLKPVSAARALYGKAQTKKAIQNVLEAVLNQYRYTTLPELNTVLKQYNVIADRGTEDSRIYTHNGLLYRVLDASGNPIGVPIKASLFYDKPTLKFLEQKFKENEQKRVPYKSRIKNAIDMALTDSKMTLEGLVSALQKQGIHAALRTNESGMIYGVTYVDHQTKCVFNGSELGKQYSAKGIQERCLAKATSEEDLTPRSRTKEEGLKPQAEAPLPETREANTDPQVSPNTILTESLLNVLMQPERTADYVPYELKKKSKKRKTKKLNNNQ